MYKQERKLTYALNSEGRLVHVDAVPTGQNCSCFCPACHEPLLAKNSGKIRVHHFAHQSDTQCASAYETMLHRLAKEKVQQAFMDKRILCTIEYQTYCKRNGDCHYRKEFNSEKEDFEDIRNNRCCVKENIEIPLWKYYDCCEQEVPYGNIKRRSDLKLFSSTHPKRDPVYIEFCVTHASDTEKLHSGNRIVECLIESEEDIDEIVNKGFKGIVSPIVKEHIRPKMQFYGFPPKVDVQLNREIKFGRYILYPSGNFYFSLETCKCQNLHKSRKNSLYEVCFHAYCDVSCYAKYIGYAKYSIPNCKVCKNYITGNGGKKCRLHKYMRLGEDFDTACAKRCLNFTFNQKEKDWCDRYFSYVLYDELK